MNVVHAPEAVLYPAPGREADACICVECISMRAEAAMPTDLKILRELKQIRKLLEAE